MIDNYKTNTESITRTHYPAIALDGAVVLQQCSSYSARWRYSYSWRTTFEFSITRWALRPHISSAAVSARAREAEDGEKPAAGN